jgi:HTH-type transcriptional regulator/antitoxin HigA
MNEITPIRSEADYEAPLAEVERLWGARSGTPQGDRLDVLATLSTTRLIHPMLSKPSKFRMEQQGLTRKDLEPVLGTRTRVAEVLNRRSDHPVVCRTDCTGRQPRIWLRRLSVDRGAAILGDREVEELDKP